MLILTALSFPCFITHIKSALFLLKVQACKLYKQGTSRKEEKYLLLKATHKQKSKPAAMILVPVKNDKVHKDFLIHHQKQ
jgi:hypothetical protein